MTARTRAALAAEITSKVDTTGQGGTTGVGLRSLLTDLSDSAVLAEDGPVLSADVRAIVRVTQAAFDALNPKAPDTLYIVVG